MAEALLVDDDPNFLSGLAALVEREGFGIRSAHSLKEARKKLSESLPDMLLLDVNLPDGSGLDLLEELGPTPPTEVVIITGHGTIAAAVQAMQMGASNYLTKPLDFARVKALLMSVGQTIELKEQIGVLRKDLRKLGRFGSLVGVSPPMQKVYDLITKVAPTDATIMLVGETGTGKELVARSVHDLSGRRRQGFVAVNCGAISPHLVSSELFGHEKGSFTGADRQHRGYFELANKGTLFLDEITETPSDLQVDLLRVLETNSFRRVGGQQLIDVDVRVIAATNLIPTEAVAQGKLREDLLYRLNVFPIQLPPLRERMADVNLLAEHILSTLNSESGTSKRFTPSSLESLRAHAWPGNVRELKNVIQRAFILSENEITIESLSLGAELVASANLQLKVGSSLAEVERRLIFATLEHSAGDKKAAAAILGISLKTLYNRLNEYKTQ